MKADLTESIGKKTKWISLHIDAQKPIYVKFEGDKCLSEFKQYLDQNQNIVSKIEVLNLYCIYQNFDYLKKLSNLKSLHIKGSQILVFPNLNKLKNLNSVYIDSFAKPTNLENISTASNLSELHIGTFTFNGPIKIESFNEIINCKKLKKLILSYSKFEEEELRKITNLKSLTEFGVHQKIDTETLAFLAAKLPNVKSKELSPMQECNTPWGNIKINGKRKPYLSKEKDKDKIERYRKHFESLKRKYAL